MLCFFKQQPKLLVCCLKYMNCLTIPLVNRFCVLHGHTNCFPSRISSFFVWNLKMYHSISASLPVHLLSSPITNSIHPLVIICVLILEWPLTTKHCCPMADVTRADAGQMPVLPVRHFLGSDRVTLSELWLTGWLCAVGSPSVLGPRPF